MSFCLMSPYIFVQQVYSVRHRLLSLLIFNFFPKLILHYQSVDKTFYHSGHTHKHNTEHELVNLLEVDLLLFPYQPTTLAYCHHML